MHDTRSRSEFSTALVLFSSARCCWKGKFASEAELLSCCLPNGALLSPQPTGKEHSAYLCLMKFKWAQAEYEYAKNRDKNDRISLPFTAKPFSDACDILCAEMDWGWWNTTLMLSAPMVIAISLNTSTGHTAWSAHVSTGRQIRRAISPLPFAIVIVECL